MERDGRLLLEMHMYTRPGDLIPIVQFGGYGWVGERVGGWRGGEGGEGGRGMGKGGWRGDGEEGRGVGGEETAMERRMGGGRGGKDGQEMGGRVERGGHAGIDCAWSHKEPPP